ncbi:MAG: hypothetical protein M1819_007093 [Sarea resinae]|nr:MAG: hypothetical protein M1819_007093 [Sarea resinae]
MSHKENEKASRYIGLLDAARSEGDWQSVPELIRKVTKHAPHRKCLILVAKSENQVATQSIKRPSTAASTSASGLPSLIPPLLTAVESEETYLQDAFQARVCLGEVHWVLGEPGLAAARLPKNVQATLVDLTEQGEELSSWSRICAVKSAYILGECQGRITTASEAEEAYASVIPLIAKNPGHFSNGSSRLRFWTERLLARYSLLASKIASEEPLDSVEDDTALEAFRLWAKFWESRLGQGAKVVEGAVPQMGFPRRHVWKAYYETLSRVLQVRLRASSDAPFIYQLMVEMKRVETSYEALLMKEVGFPKASARNKEIEEWVETVVQNWTIIRDTCTDDALGEGGLEGLTRNVLDILFRAATKTFHSTQILRHLFIVHAALADFDLAFQAFDSYLEIITRGKARSAKTGEIDHSLDDDETVLRTAADAIAILCRFGPRSAAEKANDLSLTIEGWLKHNHPDFTSKATAQATTMDGEASESDDESLTTKSQVSRKGLAATYRAIGISQAHWARHTYDAASRTEIQEKAARYFRKALAPEQEDTESLDSLFGLGLLLAEMRDIDGAIAVVKHALTPRARKTSPIDQDRIELKIKRKLIPVWHILALLLSARQEFATAIKTCEAAFEQFGGPAVLFGRATSFVSVQSPSVSPAQSLKKPTRGLVDQLEGFEKESIIQIKMTQLALLELLEGPDIAVNASNDLLALYARLFGDLQDRQTAGLAPSAMMPPKSSAGTIRSLGGSLFGRPKSVRKSLPPSATTPARPQTAIPSRPQTMASQVTTAPTIQVTSENGATPETHRHHQIFHHEGQVGGQKRNRSLKKTKSLGNIARSAATGSEKVPTDDPKRRPNAQSADQLGATDERDRRLSTLTSPSQVGLAVSPDSPTEQESSEPRGPLQGVQTRASLQSADQALPQMAHNMPQSKEPAPTGHGDGQPKQDMRLPNKSVSYSDLKTPTLQERRHMVSVLVQVWLMIAGLYRRASMYEDARGACDEAVKLVDRLQLDVSRLDCSNRAFAERGWGAGKSVEELWGDVYAEQGYLSQACAAPHDALALFDKALFHFPDHASATVGLANMLLDIYTQTIPPSPPTTTSSSGTKLTISPTAPQPAPTSIDSIFALKNARYPSQPPLSSSSPSLKPPSPLAGTTSDRPASDPHASQINSTTPEELDRLAARDRAYGLLSSLTKLGAGWDYSEAWFALARAYEESGELDRTKEVLWWCVELEEGRAVRPWVVVGAGGFVL